MGDEKPDTPRRMDVRLPVPPVSGLIPTLVDDFYTEGAMGVIVADASALTAIELTYGSRPFIDSIESLVHRMTDCLVKELDAEYAYTMVSVEERMIAIFFPRPAVDVLFLSETLPSLAESLSNVLAARAGRIVYPYLNSQLDIPVGHAAGLYRPFLRQEIQIGRLVEAGREAAHFNRERRRRERGALLQRLILEEDVTSVYEPIVDLKTDELIGFEGLSRGPAGSSLESPASLFEIASECDLSFELDGLCRRQAIRNRPDLKPGVRLFVNVLPSSLYDPDFESQDFSGLLGDASRPPKDVVLEISEREAITNYPIFREAIDHLAKLGFGLALDDVGAGYNSLEAALELNPDFLKLDMALIRGVDENPQKRELLSGLCSLAERMSAKIVAEGIETEAELATLREIGVHYGQGYLFSLPGRVNPDDAGGAA